MEVVGRCVSKHVPPTTCIFSDPEYRSNIGNTVGKGMIMAVRPAVAHHGQSIQCIGNKGGRTVLGRMIGTVGTIRPSGP